jgi:hypothetical protein
VAWDGIGWRGLKFRWHGLVSVVWDKVSQELRVEWMGGYGIMGVAQNMTA